MLFLRRGRGGSPIACPAPALDAPCACRKAPGPDATDTSRAFADISELVGAELNSAVGQVRRQTQRVHRHGGVVVQVARDIALQAREITQAAGGVNANVTAVAAAGEELSASAREIASQAARSAGTARAATLSADQAADSFTALNQTVGKIAAMSKAIAAIASRTNLLALNATIEAARAGDAGRGFAVVAGEVKELSRQTRTATDDIARCIGEVQRAMTLSVAAVQLVGSAVRSMDADSAAVAASAEQQNEAIDMMAERLQRTAASVTEVAAKIGAISGGSERVERLATDMQGEIEAADARLDEARSNVVVSLRRMTAGALHNERLVATELPACLVLPLGRRQVTVLELSDSTAILRLDPGAHEQIASLASNAAVKLSVSEGAPIEVGVLASSSTRLVVLATGLHGQDEAPFASIVSEITAKDAHFSEAARGLAARVSGCLDEAVAQGRCTEADIFDSAYIPIEGSDPPQFTTRFCETADRLVQPLLDALLTFDPRVVGTLVADRNGYTPTHNARCSLPQRAGDPLWNAVNCRNRRIFDDRAGLAAGSTTRDVLVQCYERDMGGGRIVTVREADAPIRVRGRHWGGVRLMYRGEATN